MELSDFLRLDADRQIEFLFDRSVLLSAIRRGNCRISLYQFDRFYAEIYFDERDNMIKKLTGFTSVDRLAPYLVNIDISTLLSECFG